MKISLLLGAFALTLVTAHAETLKARIGYPSALHGEVAKVLEKTDIPKKHGLEVEATFFQYGPPQIEALVSNNLDVTFTSLAPAATLLSKKPDAIVVIAGFGNAAHGLIVPEGSDAKSLANLKGKKIGVAFGSDSHVDTVVALKEAGLDPKGDVELVNIPPNEQATAFEQKSVDAVVIRQPQLSKLIKTRNAKELKHWPHHLVALARTEYLKENPEAKTKLQSAFKEAVEYIKANPKQAAEWFGEQLRQDPEAVQRIAAENPLLAPDKEVSIAPSQELQTFAKQRAKDLHENGFTKTVVEYVFE